MSDIFISYSRNDEDFGRRLHARLTRMKRDVWMDWEDIPFNSDWWEEIKRGIEVGHIFQLGDKYAQAMNAGVLNEQGKHQILNMGCYGVGVSRIVAAAIEQNHDDNGIIWPTEIAPFKVVIVPMNMHKSVRVQKAANELYDQLLDAGVEVLFDDRKERAGVMFADMELVGIPHTIVIGERGLDKDVLEYKPRGGGDKEEVAIGEMVNFIKQKLA